MNVSIKTVIATNFTNDYHSRQIDKNQERKRSTFDFNPGLPRPPTITSTDWICCFLLKSLLWRCFIFIFWFLKGLSGSLWHLILVAVKHCPYSLPTSRRAPYRFSDCRLKTLNNTIKTSTQKSGEIAFLSKGELFPMKNRVGFSDVFRILVN